MNNTSKSIARTNYFEQTKTWTFRCLQFSIAVFVLYLVDLHEMQNGFNLLLVCIIPLLLFFIGLPVDDLALDQSGMHFIKRSLFSILNSTKTYPINSIKRVGFSSLSRAPSVFGLLVPAPGIYRLEFTFQDNSSKSEDVFIVKKDLLEIIAQFRSLQTSMN
ncbi:hypothetical protein WBG78_07850 [Chryseolinea sp. T2]|uniref:hypothetical protein n=1 Tax=Chryseolinea sp. T2 TaxID=3129255 RepID=UPI0030774A17